MADVIVGDLHSSIQGQSNNSYLCDSISLNFEGDIVALGTSNTANGSYTYQGKVEISYWNSTTKRWNHGSGNNNAVAQTLLGNLTGNTTNVKFGHEVSLDWDGDRLAVGAPGVNKVMVFDAVGAGTNKWATYVSNTLTVPSISSSAEFGFSVSLAQERGETLAVGAPGIDTAYIFEFNAANAPNEWGTGPVRTIQASNSGTSGNNTQLKNLIPFSINTELTAYTGFRWCHGINNRFGHKVRLTHFADYLIVGAPGTRETSVNSSNTYDSENGTTGISYTNSSQSQLGHARVYTSPQGESWSGTNFSQHGQTLQGGVANSLSVDSNNTMQPEFGTSCDVSWDGTKAVVGSPYFPSAGQIKTYLYNEDTNQYEKTPTTIEGNKGGNKMGMNLRLDYAGERMVSGRLQLANQESEYYSGGSTSIFDFAKNRWYELSLPIRLEPGWPTYTDRSRNPCDITSGRLACMANPMFPAGNTEGANGRKGEVRFYEFAITQSIHGNQNVGGHLKAEQIFIGSNDNTSNVNQSKRLSFGGTFLDNAYNQTFIENRLVDSSGRSELLLFKKNDIEENNQHETDYIRIKAAELRFDFHDGYHGGNDEPDSQRTRLYMNKAGQVAVGNAYWNGQFDLVSGVCLDVNDSSHFHNMVNIANEVNRPMNTTVNIDTNNGRVFKGLGTDSALIGSSAETQLYRTNVPNGAWDPQYKAFYLDDTGSAAFCINNDPGNWHSSACQVNLWIRLNDTQANCAGQLAWFLYNLATGGGHNGCRCNLTSSGLEFRYEENTTSNNLVANYTFNQNQWYHIGIQMPAEGNYPQNNGNTKLYINGAAQSLSWPGTYIYAGSHSGYWDDVGYGIGAYPWYDDVHPTVEMTQNSMNNYVASASTNSTNAWKAFTLEYKESGNLTWSSSSNYTQNYTTTRSEANSNCPTTSYSGGSVLGEWIQLQLPSAESFVGVQFGCHRKKSHVIDSYLGGSFYAGKILGSTNGSSWNLVNSFTGLTRDGYVNHDFQNTKFGSASSSYQYWRIVVTEICDIWTYAQIAQIGFIKSFTSMGIKKMWIARFGIGEGGYSAGKEKIIPNEMLTVGGTANIAKGLTINKETASNYELDVDGDINLTGDIRVNGVVQSFGGGSGAWTASGSDVYRSSGNVGIGTTTPQRYLDVAGTLNATNGGILIRNGDGNTASANAPQITFGFNGNDQYKHFIRTRHNSSAADNSIDFYVCDSTQNNSLTSGVTHNLTLESGKVGMNGITDPEAPLHINASSTGTGPSSNGIYVRQSNANKNAVMGVRVNGSGSGNPYFSWDIEGYAGWSAGIDNSNGDCWDLCENWDLNSSSGNVVAQAVRGSGRTKFRVYEHAGNITGDSNWPSWGGGIATWDILCMSMSYSGLSQRSDRNLKDNIVDIPVGLSQILQLRPVRYTWKDVPNGGPHYGLIAQEAESIIPELVRNDGDNNTYRIKQEIVPILIKATQELNTKITTLETDNASLKTQVATLETQVADLISRITALENA